MNIENRFLTINEMTRSGDKIRNVKKIVIHYVGRENTTAVANRNYFESLKNQSDVYSSSHYIVGLEGEVIRCIPESEVAWHSGNINMDYNSIAIENCHNDMTGKFNDKTIDTLTHLVADICIRYNLNPKTDIIRHYDVIAKRCPRYYVDNPEAFEKIKQTVEDIMKDMEKNDNKVLGDYKVIEAMGVNIRVEPNINSLKVGVYKYNDIVKIYEIKDGWGRTDDGWISMEYISLITSSRIERYIISPAKCLIKINNV